MNSELLKEINAAPRVALGSLLETVDVRGGTVDHNEIEGVNINKTFVPTVANLKNTDLSKYKHVPTFAFATNLGSSCIVVGKKIKQLHWKAVV